MFILPSTVTPASTMTYTILGHLLHHGTHTKVVSFMACFNTYYDTSTINPSL